MFCTDLAEPFLYLFSESIYSTVIYYSHIPSIFIALFVGTYVYFKSKENRAAAKYLFLMTVAFSLWALASLITWVNIDARIIMFFWALFPYLLILICYFALHFHYTFLFGREGSFLFKLFSVLLTIPILVLSVSHLVYNNFELVNCETTENLWFVYLYHIACAFFIFWIGYNYYLYTKDLADAREKLKARLITVGLLIFLISFSSNNFLGSFTDNYKIEQYELFSVMFLMMFLGYVVVKFKAFNMKVFGAQVFMLVLVLIIGAQFTYIRLTISYVLNGIALVLVLLAGYYLIRSVREEVRSKEKLEILSQNLAKANERLTELDKQKSEFISIASHQLRTPLTAIKGYISLLLEGSYGTLNNATNDVLNKVYSVNDRLVHLVEDLLNVSRIEAGKIQYNFQATQLADILSELYDMFLMPAKNKGLKLTLDLPKPALPVIIADPNKIKEISSNLIDNAIKYTPEGSVNISLSEVKGMARIVIADTGIGIKPEDKEHLFTKFVRSKETSRMVVSGAGLGLFVGKSFVLAHKGNIWAESDGPGKGSRFIIELPIINPELEVGTVEKKQEG